MHRVQEKIIQSKGINVMKWLSNSADFDPIKNLWGIVKKVSWQTNS